MFPIISQLLAMKKLKQQQELEGLNRAFKEVYIKHMLEEAQKQSNQSPTVTDEKHT